MGGYFALGLLAVVVNWLILFLIIRVAVRQATIDAAVQIRAADARIAAAEARNAAHSARLAGSA